MAKAGAPEAAAAAPEADTPHYAGHRQRLRTRFIETAGRGLPDYEIMELLLALAIPRQDVKPLAKRLIATFGTFGEAISQPYERLVEVDGVKEATASALMLARESALRLLEGQARTRSVISSWTALIDYLSARHAYNDTESFHVLFLDRKNMLIKDEPFARGTVDQAPVYPREVARRGLELAASAAILVHNHPSGDPTPSRADIDMTREVAGALKAIGITLHDHVVIGRGQHISFKSQGLI
jgi:DNA repair protein RadC